MHKVAQIREIMNADAKKALSVSLPMIHAIAQKGAHGEGSWNEFLSGLAQWIVRLNEITNELSGDYKKIPVERLQQINDYFYEDQRQYEASYANPTFAVKKLGEGYGQIAAFCRSQFRGYIHYALERKWYKMAEFNQLYLDIHALFEHAVPSKEMLQILVCRPFIAQSVEKTAVGLYEWYAQEYDSFKKHIEICDISTDHYLFTYGEYISDYERQIAAFMRKYPEEKLDKLAQTIANAYIRGFELSRKDFRKKKTVYLNSFAGFEKLTRKIIAILRIKGLESIVTEVETSACNRQYAYDHRFDEALYLNDEYVTKRVEIFQQAMDMCSDIMNEYSGGIYIETFGEEPFSPESKTENIVLTKEQQELRQKLNGKISEIRERYMPRTECSFNITAFPSPEIGPQFEAIFADTCEINMLDTLKYESIQQCIVDELDKAVSVEIQGVAGNRTNLSVAMQPLIDPSKHTNFVNCGADVNVPVGEVFTSPQLKGTNGVLHVPETFLDGLKYTDLEITFTDGFVSAYSCKNFSDDEENKKYIEENLLFPHKTLPLGEFAIGTNTLAYAVAQKYTILEKMPILIVEKMGPHFALGDTCFSHEEDFAVYNPIDGKEITARDNDKSLLRKTDMDQAYTFNHTDITLPYEGIGNITSIHADGTRVDVIKDGHFVLNGTEELNKSLKI